MAFRPMVEVLRGFRRCGKSLTERGGSARHRGRTSSGRCAIVLPSPQATIARSRTGCWRLPVSYDHNRQAGSSCPGNDSRRLTLLVSVGRPRKPLVSKGFEYPLLGQRCRLVVLTRLTPAERGADIRTPHSKWSRPRAQKDGVWEITAQAPMPEALRRCGPRLIVNGPAVPWVGTRCCRAPSDAMTRTMCGWCRAVTSSVGEAARA